MNIRCIFVDDEPMGLSVLQSHAAKVPFLEVAGAFSGATEALAFLRKEKVDAVFLDIRMPDLSGLEIARLLRDDTRIIFTTAYPQYAIEGFELAVTDYLLKPVSFERFMLACSRIKPETPEDDFIFVKSGYDQVRIDLNTLLYLQAEDNYVTFYEKDRKTLCRMTLTEALGKLPSIRFIRIHKSYAAAVSKIDKIGRAEVIIAGKTLPVSASFREELLRRLADQRTGGNG